MNNMVENRMVLDRAWPVEKPQSREDRIDELVRAAMFREWGWIESLTPADLRDLTVDVVHACWRGRDAEYKGDHERLAAVKAAMLNAIEAWAEKELDNED